MFRKLLLVSGHYPIVRTIIYVVVGIQRDDGQFNTATHIITSFKENTFNVKVRKYERHIAKEALNHEALFQFLKWLIRLCIYFLNSMSMH